ncbi:thiolase-like protein [Lactarius psammicola]|nr:thiolase-like protein [Lactarius psammicola]
MFPAAALAPGITYDFVEAAFVGYVYGESTMGQAALYRLGLTGIPIMNVNNNYSTGGATLATRVCAVALGFDPMAPAALGINTASLDRPNQPHATASCSCVPRVFGVATVEYFKRHGGGVGHLSKIDLELTKYMCSPTSDGAACCIVANEAPVHDNKPENQAIELVATGLPTDFPEAFAGRSAMDIVGYGGGGGGVQRLADKIFAEAGVSRDDVRVVELHNCFAANERRDNTYGGKYVVNPSGGLEAKGHPIGDTGLAMHFSMTRLFDLPSTRGMYCLVHNIGLGGAVVVSPLRRPEFYHADGPDGRNR